MKIEPVSNEAGVDQARNTLMSGAKAKLRPHYHRAALAMTRWRYFRYLERRLGPYVCRAELGPAPPKDLFLKTAFLNEQQFEQGFAPGSALIEKYFRSCATFLQWFPMLEEHGFNLRTVGTILDLGCGSARLLRHLRCLEGVRLVGCDVNADCVNWCQENLPGIEFYMNALEPPLSFANAAEFDFVYAYSVFTHIPLAWQRPWLEEIKRILKPGGFFICTVCGARHIQEQLGEAERQCLDAQGHLELSSKDEMASLSTRVGGSGWDVFQTRSEVVATFGDVFHLLDYLPASQDILILQKRA